MIWLSEGAVWYNGFSVAVTCCLLRDGSMEFDWAGNKMWLVRQ